MVFNKKPQKNSPTFQEINENKLSDLNRKNQVSENSNTQFISNLGSLGNSKALIEPSGEEQNKTSKFNEDLINNENNINLDSNLNSNLNLNNSNNSNNLKNKNKETSGLELESKVFSHSSSLEKEEKKETNKQINTIFINQKFQDEKEIKNEILQKEISEGHTIRNDNNEVNENLIQNHNQIKTKIPQNLSIYNEEMASFKNTESLDKWIKDEDLKIRIIEIKIVNDGFFFGNHTEYVIETNPQHWRVNRRFNHFRQLRDGLLKLYPGYIIPPIHKIKKSNDLKFLNKRKSFLQKFLEELSDDPILRTTNELKAFLSYQKPQEWEKLIEDSKRNQITKVEETKNINGKAKLEFDKNLETFCLQIGESMNSMIGILLKIKQIQKELSHYLLAISEKYNLLSQLYTTLSCEIQKLEHSQMADLMISLNIINSKQSSFYIQEVGMIQEHMINYMKYFYKELEVSKENYLKWEETKFNFQKAEQKLKLRKESLFSDESNFSKWEISSKEEHNKDIIKSNKVLAFSLMIPKESNQLLIQKEYYGYITNKLKEGFIKLLDKYNKKLRIHFKTVANIGSNRIFKLNEAWNTFEKSILFEDVTQ